MIENTFICYDMNSCTALLRRLYERHITSTSFNSIQQMAAHYCGSIPRWQHNLMGQSPDGSIILNFNQQMAAQYYISINRWQHNLMGQSQLAAQYYISITRWQHNIIFFNQQMAAQSYISFSRWQHNIIFQSADGSTVLYFNHQMAA